MSYHRWKQHPFPYHQTRNGSTKPRRAIADLVRVERKRTIICEPTGADEKTILLTCTTFVRSKQSMQFILYTPLCWVSITRSHIHRNLAKWGVILWSIATFLPFAHPWDSNDRSSWVISFEMFSYLFVVWLLTQTIWIYDLLHTLSLRMEIILAVSSLSSACSELQFAEYVLDIWQPCFFDVFTIRIGEYPLFSMLFC